MTTKGSFEVINPPNLLAAKVPKRGGPNLKAVVKGAEQALEDLQDSFEEWLQEDLSKLMAALEQAQRPQEASEAIEQILDISHNLKGQAATFDFPLLTLVADSLCRLIRANEDGATEHLGLIALHAEAMGLVANMGIRGSGGTQGQELVATLASAVDKVLATSAPPAPEEV